MADGKYACPTCRAVSKTPGFGEDGSPRKIEKLTYNPPPTAKRLRLRSKGMA